MNFSHQEESMDIQETEFGGASSSKQRRIIHFASGETMEVKDSEEEEEEEEEEEKQSSNRPPFSEPAKRARFSFKTMALVIGRISLLTCDFLGERLASALGLDAAKYQYAIDQYYRDQKTTRQQTSTNVTDGRTETNTLTSDRSESYYGATGDVKDMDKDNGRHNRGYQADED